jgi:hypothetical protein
MRRRSRFALIAGLVFCMGPATLAGQTEPPGYLGTVDWSDPDPWFGGLSGLELSADGRSLTALSDRGAFVTARLSRNRQGQLTGVAEVKVQTLRGIGNQPLGEGEGDSEGLALLPDGQALVSFEGPARILRYPGLGEGGALVPAPRDFEALAKNGALESLAVDASGSVHAIPEESLRPDGDFPVYRLEDGTWSIPFLVESLGTFLPVGADFGPDGRLYVLERQFRGLGGFATRLRRFDPMSTGAQAGEVLLHTAPGRFGNLEGVAVWQVPRGGLRATLLSDDNFLPVLRTELVEFDLPD